jgi:hypothetical protein
MPAPIIDEASLLQHAGHKRHAGTSDTQHFAAELLRERNVIAAEQVMASQQPTREPRLQRVSGMAGCALLCLRQNKLSVARQSGV